MTIININGVKTINSNIPKVAQVDFTYLGHQAYGATEVRRIYASYLSSIVVGSSTFIRWDKLVWNGVTDNNSGVYFYFRSATSQDDIASAKWYGPYLDKESNMSAIQGRFLQALVVLRNDGVNNGLPLVNGMQLKFLASENSVKFYTRTFNVGFTPKHAVLTYNADESDDAIIRFAISGDDTADVSKYQFIEPNKIVRLDAVSYLSDKVKILVEIVGSSDIETAVHEFALMFGGDSATRINKELLVSSSSNSTSESSVSSESSSSSIDSSSSSSMDYSESTSSSSWAYSSGSSSSSVDSSSSDSSSSMSVIEGIWPPLPLSESSSSFEGDESSSSSSSEGESSSSSSEALGIGIMIINGIEPLRFKVSYG